MSQVNYQNTGGGGGSGITTIDGDSGSITGSTVTIFANQAIANCGQSVYFVNSGTTSTLNVTDSDSNTVIGLNAGVSTFVPVIGVSNTALGLNAMNAASQTSYSVAIGESSMGLSQAIDTSVAAGYFALPNATGGTQTVAIGYTSLSTATSSNNNTAVGSATLFNLVNGASNIALGWGAGISYNGSESANICLGDSGDSGENFALRLGSRGLTTPGVPATTTTYIQGVSKATFSAATPIPYLTLTDSTNGQVVSPLPVAANFASSTFGSLAVGTARQNTAPYPILVNVFMSITVATTGVVLVGVSSSNTPAPQAITSSLSAPLPLSFSFVVPANYYAEVTTTGTVTVASITTFVTQIG